LDIDGYAYGGEVSKWLSKFLEMDNVDLLAFSDELEPRQSKYVNEQTNKAQEDDLIMYNDYSAYMLISQESLKALNARLKKKVPMNQFRPVFTVKDCDAFAEDNWNKFSINDAVFRKIKHCTRCLLTTVDQEQGVKDPEQEPLTTLKEFRSNKEMYGLSPMFGINFSPSELHGTVVSVGDSIRSEE